MTTAQLVALGEMAPEAGLCWTCALPAGCGRGDDADNPQQSGLRLFEDGREIGPAHSVHDEIRKLGGGRFSHWGDRLYLSAAIPGNRPDRCRYMALAEPATGALRRPAENATEPSVLLAEAISRSARVPESEFHAILCARLLSIGLATERNFRLGHTVEIGSYSHPGLAFLLLLLGAERITLNNRKPITNHLSAAYVENLVCMTTHHPAVRQDWRSLVTADDNGYRIRPELLQIIDGVDAANIKLETPADFIVSFSVLEHIRHLPQVLVHLHRLLRPDGAMFHWVDVRDHTSFTDPLAYLRLCPEDFFRSYSKEHNRWRPSDYLRLLDQAGFAQVSKKFYFENPLHGRATDILWFIREDLGRCLVNSITDVEPFITDQMRCQLHPDFRSYSCSELSVTAFCALSRPRQSR